MTWTVLMERVKKDQIRVWGQAEVHVTVHSVIRRCRRSIRDSKWVVDTFHAGLISIFINILQFRFTGDAFLCACGTRSFCGQIVIFNVWTSFSVRIRKAEYVSESSAVHVQCGSLWGRPSIHLRVPTMRRRVGGVSHVIAPAVVSPPAELGAQEERGRVVFYRKCIGSVPHQWLLFSGD